MGHFSHCCKLTGVPITGGNAVLIVMKPVKNLYDNSEETLRKYGSTYLCSNEGTRLKYLPIWFPIRGEYDTYGRLENIVEDDQTKILEEYYGLKIQEILDIICSGRKDDGYDDSLKIIKKPFVYPADWIQGEKHYAYYQRVTGDVLDKKVKGEEQKHYARYQEWTKTNPDPERDYGNPQYVERYKELLTYSGMWIHGDVYNKLTSILDNKKKDAYDDRVDLGVPAILEALGFIESPEKSKDKRYTRIFTQGNVVLNSDGTCIHVAESGIYTLNDLKKYCAEQGLDLDISVLASKDRMEQLLTFFIPKMKNYKDYYRNSFAEHRADFEEILPTLDRNSTDSAVLKRIAAIERILNEDKEEDYPYDFRGSRQDENIFYYLLAGVYGGSSKPNAFTELFFNAVREGRMHRNIIEFWRFDTYMFCCGRYYEIVGTAPQDGEHKKVVEVLTVAQEVLHADMEERGYFEEEDKEIEA